MPGESNKRVVFDAVRSLAEVYVRNDYNVIVCGLFAWPVHRLQMSRSVTDLVTEVLRATEHGS